MNKDTIKKNIESAISESVNNFIDIFTTIEQEIDRLKIKKTELQDNILEFSNQRDLIKTEITKERSSITKEKESLNEKIKEYNLSKKESEDKLNELNNNKIGLEQKTELLKQEVKSLEDNKKSLSVFEGIKTNLLQEISDLKDKIKTISESNESNIKANKVILETLNKEISDKKKEQEEVLSKLMPIKEELDAKAKQLDIKEKNLIVLEKRLKLRYGK